MADKKISALTSASTPLAGTEVLPIVQSGSTVKVSVNDLTVGRAVSVGTLATNTTSSANNAQFYSTTNTGVYVRWQRPNKSFIWALDINNNGGKNFSIFDETASATRFDISDGGDVTVNTGNLVIGTSGKGIDFSATSGTGTSELLADYEEGDWTATLTGSVSNPTLTAGSINRAYYTKVGRVVYITATIQWTASSGGSGDLSITGLPFTSNNNAGNYGSISVGYNTGIATGVGSILRIYQTPNTTTLSLFGQIDATLSTTTLTTAAIQTTGTVYLIIEGFYFV